MNVHNSISNYSEISKYRSNRVSYVAEIKVIYTQRPNSYMDSVKMFGARILQALLATLTFTVQLFPEDDGSVTGSVEELDLFENSATKDGCMRLLLEDMREYARDFCSEFALWSSAPNRRKHIPYVAKILCASDEKLRESMICQPGGN